MECCCYVWAGAFSCYLDILDILQKWVSRTVSRSLAVSLLLLNLRRNVASSEHAELFLWEVHSVF